MANAPGPFKISADPVAIPDGDQQIWAAYGEQVKNAITGGQTLGPNDAVYICPPTFVTVPGGPWVAPSVTNDVVGSFGDSLLEDNSPLYNSSSAGGGYFQSLQSYMSFVDPDKTITSALKTTVKQTLKRASTKVDTTAKSLNQAVQKAKNSWQTNNASLASEGLDPIAFAEWMNENPDDPAVTALNAAQKPYDDAIVGYATIMGNIYGPVGTTVADLMQKLHDAADTENNQPTLNMPITTADVPSSFAAWLKDSTKIASDSTDIGFSPAYSMHGFSDAVLGWAQSMKDQPKPELRNDTVWKLNIKSASHDSWRDLGHSEAHTSDALSVFIFFSQGSTHDESTSWNNFKSDDASSDVELTLRFAGLQSFQLKPGTWDIPGVTKQFPDLQDNHPKDLDSGLIQITTLLVGYGVGLEAQFHNQAINHASTFWEKVTHDHTQGMRILGFQVGSDSDSSSQQIISTDSVKFSESDGSMSIPQLNNGFPVVLGMIGQKMSNSTSASPAVNGVSGTK